MKAIIIAMLLASLAACGTVGGAVGGAGQDLAKAGDWIKAQGNK